MNLAEVFSRGDPVSRFGGLATMFRTDDVAQWNYYKSHVDIEVETKSGIVSLAARTYDPISSKRLADRLLADAVIHLTEMNRERERQMLASAQARVDQLNADLRQEETALAAYRSRIGVYDPGVLYQSQLGLLNALTTRQTELSGQYRSVVREAPNSPATADLRSAIAQTGSQLELEKDRISRTSELAAAFDNLRTRRDNTLTALQQANMALQEARREAVNNGYYLNLISPPSQPVTPLAPHRLRWILGILLASFVVWAILR